MKFSIKQQFVLALPLFFTAAIVGCKKDTPVATPATVSTTSFLVSGSSRGAFNLYGFETGAPVSNSDSVSTKWDFAMRFEKIIVNSNSSGPGNAGVQIVNSAFEAVTTAPEAGYNYDTTSTNLAVKGSDWYTYNPTTRSFSPIAGKTFVFRTAANKYAKMEFLSADPTDDNGVLVTPPTRPTKIKYTIRYAFQPSGTRVF